MIKFFVFCMALLVGIPNEVKASPKVTSGNYQIQNFEFADGAVLPELILHYRTIGTPKKDATGRITNAILLLHGTNGSGEAFLKPSLSDFLFGPGDPLDASEYYIILPDAIGCGQSSKPSDGLKASFPNYRYLDMVRGSHQLVTEKLGVGHLLLVCGISMGGMHTWMWGEQYPDMMDALMPIACFPVAVKGRNLLMRKAISDSIRSDPEWEEGNYEKQPSRLWTSAWAFYLLSNGILHLDKVAPTMAAANELIEANIRSKENVDANNYLYGIEAFQDYNPEPDLGKIKAKVFAVNFMDDEINPDVLQVLETRIKKVKHGKYVVLPASDQTNGHLSIQMGNLWAPYIKKLLKKSS